MNRRARGTPLLAVAFASAFVFLPAVVAWLDVAIAFEAACAAEAFPDDLPSLPACVPFFAILAPFAPFVP